MGLILMEAILMELILMELILSMILLVISSLLIQYLNFNLGNPLPAHGMDGQEIAFVRDVFSTDRNVAELIHDQAR